MRRTHDVVVIGLGAMGSATLLALARRGVPALGLDTYQPPHDRGSHHGLTRIIRLAYHEHPAYVRLLRRAYPLWRELEEEAGTTLLHRTGSLDAGARDDSPFVTGSIASCVEHGLEHEVLTAPEVSARFPGFRLPADFVAVFQPDGGFLAAEDAVGAQLALAQRRGAAARTGERVLGFEARGDTVAVRTERERLEAGALVVTAGAWAASLLPAFAPLARPERQVVGWFRPKRPELFDAIRCPVFDILFEEGNYYGIPATGQPGFKIGRHGHLHQPADPDTLDRVVSPRDKEVLRRALARYFPEADGETVALSVCLFTNSPDDHFVIDRVHDAPPVVAGAAFSGHGFKFAPVVGEILADLATGIESSHDLALFSLARFA